VPARYPEAFGLYVIESMLAGTPVVLPSTGAFPELVDSTQGGVLYDPELAGAYTQSLNDFLLNRKSSQSMGMQAHQSVIKQYSNENLAQQLVENILSPISVI
jgi:glycosyltransferase involved in cell wall biosynthesis